MSFTAQLVGHVIDSSNCTMFDMDYKPNGSIRHIIDNEPYHTYLTASRLMDILTDKGYRVGLKYPDTFVYKCVRRKILVPDNFGYCRCKRDMTLSVNQIGVGVTFICDKYICYYDQYHKLMVSNITEAP